jgi:hypothetical protein
VDAEFARLIIRHRIADRRLPHSRAVDVSERSGDGRRCDGCAEPIMPTQSAVWAAISEWMFIRLHEQCFELWNSERLWVSKPECNTPSY